MITALLILQTVVIVYLLYAQALQRERALVLSHFLWSVVDILRSHHQEEQFSPQLCYDAIVARAVDERLDFTWVNLLQKFIRRNRGLFADERFGRFGTALYKSYFEQIAESWRVMEAKVPARDSDDKKWQAEGDLWKK